MGERWSRISAAADAALATIAASLNKFADDLNEATKRRPETDYWRGYTDAMDDMANRDV